MAVKVSAIVEDNGGLPPELFEPKPIRVTYEVDEFDQKNLDIRVSRLPTDHVDDEVFVSQKTAAHRLEVSVNHFRVLTERYKIQGYAFGRSVRYRWGDIKAAMLKKNGVKRGSKK